MVRVCGKLTHFMDTGQTRDSINLNTKSNYISSYIKVSLYSFFNTCALTPLFNVKHSLETIYSKIAVSR